MGNVSLCPNSAHVLFDLEMVALSAEAMVGGRVWSLPLHVPSRNRGRELVVEAHSMTAVVTFRGIVACAVRALVGKKATCQGAMAKPGQ